MALRFFGEAFTPRTAYPSSFPSVTELTTFPHEKLQPTAQQSDVIPTQRELNARNRLKNHFFRSENFNIYYDSEPEKILYNAAVRSYLARKNSYLARKNFYLGDKFSYLRGRKPWF